MAYVWTTGSNLIGSVGLFGLFSYPYPTCWSTSWSRLSYSSACGYGRVKTLADVYVRNCKGDISAIGVVNFRRNYMQNSRFLTTIHDSVCRPTAFINNGLLVLLGSKQFVALLLKWENGSFTILVEVDDVFSFPTYDVENDRYQIRTQIQISKFKVYFDSDAPIHF